MSLQHLTQIRQLPYRGKAERNPMLAFELERALLPLKEAKPFVVLL